MLSWHCNTMFDHHNVLQWNHYIISMIVSTLSQHLTLNTLLKCCKSTKPCRGQICDVMSLHFYGKQCRLERFAWLVGLGIYHGHLNLGTSPRFSPITHALIGISYLSKCLLFTTNLDYVIQEIDAGFWNDSSQFQSHTWWKK